MGVKELVLIEFIVFIIVFYFVMKIIMVIILLMIWYDINIVMLEKGIIVGKNLKLWGLFIIFKVIWVVWNFLINMKGYIVNNIVYGFG